MTTGEALGVFLARKNLITRAQAEEAVQNQSILGGRIGTNLIELGHIRLDDLETALAEYFNVPAAETSELDNINPHLLRTIPRRLIEKYRFLPLRRTPHSLQIATMDPMNQIMLKELSGVLAIPIEPRVASEVRVYFYLDRYYEMKADMRFRTLFFHYRKSKAAGKDLPGGQNPHGGKIDLIKKGFRPLEKGEELTDEGFEEFLLQNTILREAPQTPPQPNPTRAPVSEETYTATIPNFATTEEIPPIETPVQKALQKPERELLTIEDLSSQMSRLQDREQIAELVLRFARQYVEACVIFSVHAGLVSGWNARGRKLSKDSVKNVIVPLAADSVFHTVHQTKGHFAGHLSPKNLNTALLHALALEPDKEVMVIPIFLKKRLVNILFADNGSLGFSSPIVNAFLGLSRWLPEAYTHIILNRKKALHAGLRSS